MVIVFRRKVVSSIGFSTKGEEADRILAKNNQPAVIDCLIIGYNYDTFNSYRQKDNKPG